MVKSISLTFLLMASLTACSSNSSVSQSTKTLPERHPSSIKDCNKGMVKSVFVVEDEDERGRLVVRHSLSDLSPGFNSDSEPTHYVVDQKSLPKNVDIKKVSLVLYTINKARERLSGYAVNKLSPWNVKGNGRYFASAGRNDVSRFRSMVYDPIDRYHTAIEKRQNVSKSKVPRALVLSLQTGKKILCQHTYEVYVHSD